MCWSQSDICYPLGLCIEVIKKKMTAKYPVLKKTKVLLFADNCCSIGRTLCIFHCRLHMKKICFYISPWRHCCVHPYWWLQRKLSRLISESMDWDSSSPGK